jgi:hypothetical protein
MADDYRNGFRAPGSDQRQHSFAGREGKDRSTRFVREAYVQIYEKAYFLRMRGTLGDAEWERFAGGNAIIGFLVDDGLSEPDSERIADEALEKIAECRSRFASESGQRP